MTSGFGPPRSDSIRYRTVFNHVGLCVADTRRSRRFYEGLLGFEFWWELEPPDEGTDQLLQLAKPLGLHATYLVRDGLVLELLDYSEREVHAGPDRVMDQPGLTHLSLSVSDLADVLTMVHGFGGSVVQGTVSEQSAMIRDPDGQLLELLSESWLAVPPPRPPADGRDR
jgi:lactoylglutathione lyase